MPTTRLDGRSFAAPARGLLAAITAFALLDAGAARAQFSRFEPFDTDLGAWDTLFGAQSDGFDIGWSDTSFASGDS